MKILILILWLSVGVLIWCGYKFVDQVAEIIRLKKELNDGQERFIKSIKELLAEREESGRKNQEGR